MALFGGPYAAPITVSIKEFFKAEEDGSEELKLFFEKVDKTVPPGNFDPNLYNTEAGLFRGQGGWMWRLYKLVSLVEDDPFYKAKENLEIKKAAIWEIVSIVIDECIKYYREVFVVGETFFNTMSFLIKIACSMDWVEFLQKLDEKVLNNDKVFRHQNAMPHGVTLSSFLFNLTELRYPITFAPPTISSGPCAEKQFSAIALAVGANSWNVVRWLLSENRVSELEKKDPMHFGLIRSRLSEIDSTSAAFLRIKTLEMEIEKLKQLLTTAAATSVRVNLADSTASSTAVSSTAVSSRILKTVRSESSDGGGIKKRKNGQIDGFGLESEVAQQLLPLHPKDLQNGRFFAKLSVNFL